jgi:hypothetical protein
VRDRKRAHDLDPTTHVTESFLIPRNVEMYIARAQQMGCLFSSEPVRQKRTGRSPQLGDQKPAQIRISEQTCSWNGNT